MPPYWTIQRPGRLGDLQMAAAGLKLAATGQQLVVLRELADDLVGGVLSPRPSGQHDNRTVTMFTTA